MGLRDLCAERDELSRVWDLAAQLAERHKLPLSPFEQSWAQNGQIVAVQPHDDFLPYFQATQQLLRHHPAQGDAESGSDGGRSLTLPPELSDDIEVWGGPPPH